MSDKTKNDDADKPMFGALLTTEEVARLLRVSPPTVRALQGRGLLTPIEGLRHFRFSASDVSALIEKKK